MERITVVNSPLSSSDESRFLYTIARNISDCNHDNDKTFQSPLLEPIILVWSLTQGFRKLLISDDGISFTQPSEESKSCPAYVCGFLRAFDSPLSNNYTNTPPLDFANIMGWLMNLVRDLPPAMPKINIIILDADKALSVLDAASRVKFWRSLKDFALGDPHKANKGQRRWKTSELKIWLSGQCVDASPIEGFYSTEEFPYLSEEEIRLLLSSRKTAYTKAFGEIKADFIATQNIDEALIKELRGLAEQEILALCDKSLKAQKIKKGKKEAITLEWKSDAIEVVQAYKISKLKQLGVDLSPKPDSSIGGLESLKSWILTREALFSKEAKKYNLPYPKGIMLVGPPGTGKSLIAKSIGAYWHIPVLSLDIGSVYGSLLGQSEQNLRKILDTAKAIAPCILFIDELDKGLSTAGSTASDGGTSSRIFGNLLTWMSDKTEPVFVIATANNLSAIMDNAPELMRKGRWDEIFYVDLPRKRERREIFEIHAKKHNAVFDKNVLDFLVESTAGNSAADIASIVYTAVSEKFSTLMRNNEELPDIIELKEEYFLRNVIARHPKQKIPPLDPRLNCILANQED